MWYSSEISQGKHMQTSKNCFLSYTKETDPGFIDLEKMLSRRGFHVRSQADLGSTFYIENESNQKAMEEPFLSRANLLIVYIDASTHAHSLTKWEVEYALQQGSRIIGVWSISHKDCHVPDVLKTYADAVVRFDEERIVAAIEGENIFECPDGTLWQKRDIERREC
jgi:hypothetical protein